MTVVLGALRLVPLFLSTKFFVGGQAESHMARIEHPEDLSAIEELYVPLEHVCDGFEEQWDNCKELPKCGPCTPRDCVFGSWGEWQLQGGCTGLELRHRVVEVESNHCGEPCTGSLTETATYVLDECLAKGADCQLSAWSPWTQCADKKDQSMRTRKVQTPPTSGGKDCMGSLQETRPCGGPKSNDCLFGSWHEWTSCSVSCGFGRHTRMRYVDSEAHHGGHTCNDMLLETQVCGGATCDGQNCEISEWNLWSTCDEMFTQRFRHRQVLREPSGSGTACNGALQETIGCPQDPKEDCVIGDWEGWGLCDKTCDGGQRFRERNLKVAATHGGTCPLVQLKESGSCSTQPCNPGGPEDCQLEEWAQWGACAASCGEGTTQRSRRISHFAVESGKPCTGALHEATKCVTHMCHVQDCRWSDWEQWSSCSVSCDGGTKTRTRNIAVSPQGGSLCEPKDKSEVAPCATQTCGEGCIDGAWGEWREWTPCSGSCNDAYRYRRRSVDKHPNYCGNATEGIREEYAQCDRLPTCNVDKDCEVSPWSTWTGCSCHCFGMRHRARFIATFPAGAGRSCVDESLKEIEPCNPGPGEVTPMDCSNERQQDCKIHEWEGWSQCSVTCGGGQRSRIREVEQHAQGGGIPCETALLETEGCGTGECEAHQCQDCRWSAWSPWGQCPRCGGQRYRHRNIEIMPNRCGKRCELKSAKEVTDCPLTPECNQTLFCTWTEWTSKDCSGRCGHSTTMISRSLGLYKSLPFSMTGQVAPLFEAVDLSKCAGTQMNQTVCTYTHPCERCIPIPCEFAEWAEWAEPTCDGLCQRSRTIKAVNNECGLPCDGPLTETKQCKADCMNPRDCLLSDWGDWSGCTDPGQSNGQRYRAREIKQSPMHGGKPCLGILEDTVGCHQAPPKPCTFTDWGEWNSCTARCGSGWHQRTRNIEDHANRGGLSCDGSLRELDECTHMDQTCGSDAVVPCILEDWGTWSTCDHTHMRFRDRPMTQEAKNGGEPCSGETNQGISCGWDPVPCQISAWTTWGPCDRPCGAGQQQRQRQIEVFPKNNGLACPDDIMETQGCLMKPCAIVNTEVSDWGEWGGCSENCGPGVQKRRRTILHLRNAGGRGYEGVLGEARECHNSPVCKKEDCKWSNWEAWSGCSCTCGGGTQHRARRILTFPRGGGARCDGGSRKEVQGCNMKRCDGSGCNDGQFGDWTVWAECSASCDGGTTFRTRNIVQEANECGCPPPGKDRETAFCNVDKSCTPSVDCKLSHWTDWGGCTASCNGIKVRSRSVEQYGKGLGLWCTGGLEERYPCNPSPGEDPSAACEGGDPVDCKESEWTGWSVCSKSCGGGEHLRSRYIQQHPKFGGRECNGALAQLKECARNECGGPAPVDCVFGSWQAWSLCNKCNGERKRRRLIISYPKYGGEECKPKQLEEVGACPRRCTEQKYCAWATWGDWSPCTVTCGRGGKRRRRRYLALTAAAKASLPAYISNVMNEYEALSLKAQDLSRSQFGEMILAFGVGCVTLMVAVAGVRAVSAAASGRESSYAPLNLDTRQEGVTSFEIE